jgi:hypothetical protein
MAVFDLLGLCSAKLEPRPISEQFTASEQGKKSKNYEQFKGKPARRGDEDCGRSPRSDGIIAY